MNIFCQCGHPSYIHDYHRGCAVFLCCDRTRTNYPGKWTTAHDGANHQAKPCPCQTFTKPKSRWDEDMEAGAIG